MKSFRKFAISRASLISIISIGVILFSISSIDKGKKNVVFEVAGSKVSISGTGSASKWKMETNAVSSSGNFEAKGNELLTISALSFTVPVNQLKSDDQQLESIINEIFLENNFNELIFKQRFSMVLPIMKKIHVIGELSMLNGTRMLPLQVDYELTNDRVLRIKTKHSISLSEYGIKIPSHLTGVIDDQVVLEIDFVLENRSV